MRVRTVYIPSHSPSEILLFTHIVSHSSIQPSSPLAIFDFWSSFWLKWKKMLVDMTIREHWKPFWMMLDLASLLAISTFDLLSGWNWHKYDLIWLLGLLRDMKSHFGWCLIQPHFWQVSTFGQHFAWNGWEYDLISL